MSENRFVILDEQPPPSYINDRCYRDTFGQRINSGDTVVFIKSRLHNEDDIGELQ